MKKPQIRIFTAITLIFAAFTVGFFLGRNVNSGDVQVSAVQTMPSPSLSVPVTTAETQEELTVSFPIDLNTATKEELMALPGIGEIFAQRILDYRETKGPFQSAGDLLHIEGIGTKRLEGILDYITVGG